MNRKNKGTNAERELIHLFWKNNWAAHRVAGSGSSRYPACDVIASNKIRRLAIEAKTSKDPKKYLSNDEVNQLKEFSEMFGAEPWIALRFDRKDWLFMSLEDMKKSENSYMASVELAEAKGLLFEELIR
ncbi:MAG: Holliday junction resolvase [Nanoarchaeota archaeon]|nr:Holliday junction resolvase [Nanoarchaeota archaeon]MBU1704813.1 Holliday junction resolvase [Nanoarchaeota archaeon]